MSSRAGRGRRAVAVVVALGSMLAVPAAAEGGVAPAPPSWLDLVAQMGQVAHSQNGALVALDAAVRDGLNGTTEGYVYDIVSDAAQMLPSLRNLVADSAALTRAWTAAHAQAKVAESGWAKELSFYKPWYELEQRNPSPCNDAPPKDEGCGHDAVMVIHWWEDYPNDPSLGPPAGVGATVSSTSIDAYYQYGRALATLTEALTDAGEVALGARTIEGDAHDYPGNKEIEAVVRVIGEHQVAVEMARFLQEATTLRPHLQQQVTEMGDCNSIGREMAGDVPIPITTFPPPPPSTCAPTT